MYTDAVTVYVRQAFQEFHTFHLVFSFFDAEMAEGDIFKFKTTVIASAIIKGEHDITFVCHVDVPAACTVLPATGDHLCVRTAIYIDDGGVFLCRVEVCGFHKAVVEVGHAVGRLDGTGFYIWHSEALERIFCCKQCIFPMFFRVGRHYLYATGASGRRRFVNEMGTHKAG